MGYNLKRRVSAIIICVMLIAATVVVLEIRQNVAQTKDKVLTNYKISKKNSLDHIFNILKENLTHQLYDYAFWDDVYYAIEEENTLWLKENATEFLYEDDAYKLDYVYLQAKDKSYYEYYGDDDKLDLLKKSSFWKNGVLNNDYNIDFVYLGDELYLLALAHVSTYDRSKSNGYYVIGRKIDINYLNEFLKPYFITEMKLINFSNEYISDNKLKANYDFDLYYPIKNSNDEILNILKIKFNIRTYIDGLDELFPNIFKIILIVVSITGFIIIHYIYYIGKILDKLIIKIDYITQGNYNYKIPINGSKEVNELISHIHHMGSTIDKNINELKQASLDLIYVLVKAVEAKDLYTRGHSERVSEYAYIIGRHMHYHDLTELKTAAILHDIGKIAIDEQILNKNGKLTNEEYEAIKKHPKRGYEILRDIKPMKTIQDIIKQHHERYDGKGYPDNLKQEEIHLAARIIAVADTFDAMTSNRAYREAMEVEKAVKIISENSGTQFDPDVVQVFLQCKDSIINCMNKCKRNENTKVSI